MFAAVVLAARLAVAQADADTLKAYLIHPNTTAADKQRALSLNPGAKSQARNATSLIKTAKPGPKPDTKQDQAPAAIAQSLVPLPSPTDTHYQVLTSTRVSPVRAAVTSIDTLRTFMGADGQPVEVAILKPRGAGVYTAVANAGESGQQFLSRAVNAARSAGAHTVAITRGIYRFTGGWSLNNVQDLTIDGQGSLFEFASLGGCSFNNCNRIVFKNVYIRTRLASGQRLSSVGTVTDSQIRLNYGNSVALPVRAVAEYDLANRTWPLDRQLRETFGGGITIDASGVSNQSSALTQFNGRGVVVRHMESSPLIVCARTNDITFDSIRIGSGAHFAFKLQQGRGFHIANCAIKKDLDALSTNWDGIHIPGSGGDIIIENTEIADNGDDSINIHGVYLKIASSGGNTAQFTGESWRIQQHLDVGHHALCYDSGLRYLGRFTVSAKSGNTISFQETVPSTIGYVLADELVPRRIIINGNWSHDHRARGILLQACNASVTNNHLERMTHSGMQLTVAPGTYGEGPGPFNAVVQGNSFNTLGASSNGGYPGILNAATERAGFTLATGLKTIRMIQIIGNTFSDLRNPGARGVYLDSTVGENFVQ